MIQRSEAFDHVGLLCNEPPGQAGLLFILSSDNSHSNFDRSRLPLPDGSLNPYIVPRESGKAIKMYCGSWYYSTLEARPVRRGFAVSSFVFGLSRT